MENPPFFMGKLIMSMAMFTSFLLNYQMVSSMNIPLNHKKKSHGKSPEMTIFHHFPMAKSTHQWAIYGSPGIFHRPPTVRHGRCSHNVTRRGAGEGRDACASCASAGSRAAAGGAASGTRQSHWRQQWSMVDRGCFTWLPSGYGIKWPIYGWI